jgi:hypothetical protein
VAHGNVGDRPSGGAPTRWGGLGLLALALVVCPLALYRPTGPRPASGTREPVGPGRGGAGTLEVLDGVHFECGLTPIDCAQQGLCDRPNLSLPTRSRPRLPTPTASASDRGLDHVIISRNAHLRRVLHAYLASHNTIRPHHALAQKGPRPRDVPPPGLVSRPRF